MGKAWRGGREKWPYAVSLAKTAIIGREKCKFNAIRRAVVRCSTDLSRGPRPLPVIMKRPGSPYCLSVHYTVYYSTDGGGESQANFHKNIKNGDVWFAVLWWKILKKLCFTGIAYGNIAQKWRKTGKTRESKNNLMIFRDNSLNTQYGHITI